MLSGEGKKVRQKRAGVAERRCGGRASGFSTQAARRRGEGGRGLDSGMSHRVAMRGLRQRHCYFSDCVSNVRGLSFLGGARASATHIAAEMKERKSVEAEGAQWRKPLQDGQGNEDRKGAAVRTARGVTAPPTISTTPHRLGCVIPTCQRTRPPRWRIELSPEQCKALPARAVHRQPPGRDRPSTAVPSAPQ